jgi:hypothetical protein
MSERRAKAAARRVFGNRARNSPVISAFLRLYHEKQNATHWLVLERTRWLNPNPSGMPIPLDVSFERTFSGTAKRIYQLLTEMGTSADAIWPFASQPFMRSAGPMVPGHTEEWHLGLHAVLESVEPEKSIIWRIDNDGVDGTHGFTIVQDGKKTTVTHRVVAVLSDLDGRLLWKRIEDGHQRAIDGLFDKLGRVLKR